MQRTDDCSAVEMLSQMRFTLLTKNLQNVETSYTHWASSYRTLCLLCNSLSAIRQVARTSPAASSSSDLMILARDLRMLSRKVEQAER